MSSDSLDPKSLVFGDVAREFAVTRRILEAIPAENFPFKPHEKSMSLMNLALHVATLPGWLADSLAADTLDFASAPRPPQAVDSNSQLLGYFDRESARATNAIAAFDMAKWNNTWTMKNGDEIFTAQPRSKVARIWALNHLIHHRAQLAVYLRLLNLKVPTLYFNTADDPAWVFE